MSADKFLGAVRPSIAVFHVYDEPDRTRCQHTFELSYNKRESRRLDSLVTSLSKLDDGDGRHVVAVLGLALGELQLDAASLGQSNRRGLGVAVEAGRPRDAHLGQNRAAVVVLGVILVERDHGEGLVIDSGEVEGVDGDTVGELLDEVVGGNLLAVVLERGQQGGIESCFSEIKHNFISFLCGRQAGLFIQSRRLDLNRCEIGAGLSKIILGAVQIVVNKATAVIVDTILTAQTDTTLALNCVGNHGAITPTTYTAMGNSRIAR